MEQEEHPEASCFILGQQGSM